MKKKVEGENRFPPPKRSERCPGGRAAKPSTPIGPEDRVLERLKSASGGDRELWGEGRSKPNPKAEIPTFRVGRSRKTAGRDHRSPFGRLVVLSEGGTAKPEGPSSGLPPARRISHSSARPCCRSELRREERGFPSPLRAQRHRPRLSGVWPCSQLMAS